MVHGARYIWDQSDLQKRQVPFTGFSDYRPVLSDREKTDHLSHQDSSNFSLKAQRNPLKSLQLDRREENGLCTAVHRLINGSPQQNTLSTQQQFQLCSVSLKTCACSYFSFVFRRVQTAENSLFSVRYSKSAAWRRLGEKKNRGMMDMPTTGSQPKVKPWGDGEQRALPGIREDKGGFPFQSGNLSGRHGRVRRRVTPLESEGRGEASSEALLTVLPTLLTGSCVTGWYFFLHWKPSSLRGLECLHVHVKFNLCKTGKGNRSTAGLWPTLNPTKWGLQHKACCYLPAILHLRKQADYGITINELIQGTKYGVYGCKYKPLMHRLHCRRSVWHWSIGNGGSRSLQECEAEAAAGASPGTGRDVTVPYACWGKVLHGRISSLAVVLSG